MQPKFESKGYKHNLYNRLHVKMKEKNNMLSPGAVSWMKQGLVNPKFVASS